jgi:hypothetical protein
LNISERNSPLSTHHPSCDLLKEPTRFANMPLT